MTQGCPQDSCPLSGDVFMTDEEARHYLTEHLGWRKVCEACGGSGKFETTDPNGDVDDAACTDCDGTGARP